MKKSLALVAAALMLTLTACGGSSKDSSYTPAPPLVTVNFKAFKTLPENTTKDPELRRKYEEISVTIGTPTGTQQHTYLESMRSKSGTSVVSYKFDRGEPVYLSVQNASGIGSVTCVLSIDGRVVSENVSSADYGIASCSGVAR